MAIIGRMNNNGQSCVASQKIYCCRSHREIPKTQVGPLSSEEALQDIPDQVKRFEKVQAKIATGGKRALKKALICNQLY
jgi:succinate-semialdehyde dehydrogenase/glutarate-semialdehyde dehydrogenase